MTTVPVATTRVNVMKPYLIALAAGLLVGAIYGLLGVRSPAPPVVALVGLLGMLVGEQIVPLVKRVTSSQPLTLNWLQRQCGSHVLGSLPVAETAAPVTRERRDARS
jgi:XapX domain-containing protein